jgi:hypothetical protein
MNMSECRWIPTKVTPNGALNADGTINDAAFISAHDQMVAAIGQRAYDRLVESVILDVIGQGEDAADAYTISQEADYGVIQDTVNGRWYALVIHVSEYSSYANLFELKCGVALAVPWMVGGAVVLGAIGVGLGAKLAKGKKGLVLGGVTGAAAGAGAGVLLAKLATPSYMKSAGLGGLGRTRSGRYACMPGWRWSSSLRRCVNAPRAY